MVTKPQAEHVPRDDTSTASTAVWTADADEPSPAAAEDLWDPLAEQGSVPSSGEVFIIIEQMSRRAIALVGGELKLVTGSNQEGSCQWRCIETYGWFGFQNVVSGTYIGHDGRKNFRAVAIHHQEYEYFCPRRHPDGGYELMVPHWKSLWKLDLTSDSTGITAKADGTSRWEFIKM